MPTFEYSTAVTPQTGGAGCRTLSDSLNATRASDRLNPIPINAQARPHAHAGVTA
jgi:hypothetical protein